MDAATSVNNDVLSAICVHTSVLQHLILGKYSEFVLAISTWFELAFVDVSKCRSAYTLNFRNKQ